MAAQLLEQRGERWPTKELKGIGRNGARRQERQMRQTGNALDAFSVRAHGEHRRQPDAMRQQRYRDSLALYESVLAGFLADPGSRANLHRGPARRLVRAPV